MPLEDIVGAGKLAEAMSQPVQKLIDEVSKGIGALYKPHGIRREGDAEAVRLRAIAKAEALAEEDRKAIALAGTLNRLDQIGGAHRELVERARARLVQQEIQSQRNIEQIADLAADAMPDQVVDTPVDDEWRQRFFKNAADISAAEMQLIWGKVLAGEVSRPGAFSTRTIETLHALSPAEAKLFAEVAGCCAIWPAFGVLRHQADLADVGLPYRSVMQLRDAGLLSYDEGASWQMHLKPETVVIFAIGGSFFAARHPSRTDELRLVLYPLSIAGMELLQVVERSPALAYIKSVQAWLRTHGFEVLELTGKDLELAKDVVAEGALLKGWPVIR
jgi:hypothetical protein